MLVISNGKETDIMQPALRTYTVENELVIDIPEEFDSFKVDLARDHLDTIAIGHAIGRTQSLQKSTTF